MINGLSVALALKTALKCVLNFFAELFCCLLLLCLCNSITNAATIAGDVIDQKGQALSNVVIVATPLQPPAPETNAGKYQEVLDQRNREFMPHVLVVRSGTEVSFPNHDKIRHHVYSFSPAKRFEIKLYGDLTPTPILFDMAGIAVLGCNIHDWMVSYVYVTDSPYFAKTDVSGHWSLNLPVDSYTISYWHPYMEQIQSIMPETIQVDGGQDILLNRAIQIKSHYRNGKPPLSGQEEGYKVDP
jgi:plastocyanin